MHGTLKCKGRASVFKPLGLSLDTTLHEKCLPAFDMYLEHMAARERKLLTCSTSSPIVVPAPS